MGSPVIAFSEIWNMISVRSQREKRLPAYLNIEIQEMVIL